MTLLHYLCKLVNEKAPNVRVFVDELSILEGASRGTTCLSTSCLRARSMLTATVIAVESGNMETEVNKLVSMVKKLRDELARTADNPKDRFKPVMTEFLAMAQVRSDSIAQRADRVKSSQTSLIEFYGEEPSALKPEQLYRIFNSFVHEYKAAEAELLKLKQELDRDKQRKEVADEKARMAAQEKALVDYDKDNLAKQGGKDGTKIVDGTLKTLRANDAMDIMKMLRARRKKRGSVTTGNGSTGAAPTTLGVAGAGMAGAGSSGTLHQRATSKREMLAASLQRQSSASAKAPPWVKKT